MVSIRRMSTMRWSHSSIVTEKKSRFQGHAIALQNKDQVGEVIQGLIQGEKSLQKASHPSMYAWRLKENNGMSQGSHDCGESGAGARLMVLLERCKLDGVLVVVTRWYGGVPLGGARFRHISGAGVEALKEGGFLKR